ncbi:MAG: lysophospholipid acyltransferase family protein [Myxococcota bacterium]
MPQTVSKFPDILRGPAMLWITFSESISMIVDAAWHGASKALGDKHVKSFSHRMLAMSRTKLETRGLGHVSAGQSYVFMSNHQSVMDIPAILAAAPGSVRMVAKEGLFKVPFFGRAMLAAGFMPINRRSLEKAKQQLEHAKGSLQNGVSVWISPEGTRSKTSELLPFKKGGFHVALSLGVPIVPVWIEGAGAVIPAHSYRICTDKTICVTFGKPIETRGLTSEDLPELILKTRQAILGLPLENNG